MSTDAKIAALRPGQAVVLSETSAGYCTAERSGDGRTARLVRHIGETSTTFQNRSEP